MGTKASVEQAGGLNESAIRGWCSIANSVSVVLASSSRMHVPAQRSVLNHQNELLWTIRFTVCVGIRINNNVLSSQISELRCAYFMLSHQRWLIRIFTVDLHKWRQRISIYTPLDMLQGKPYPVTVLLIYTLLWNIYICTSVSFGIFVLYMLLRPTCYWV